MQQLGPVVQALPADALDLERWSEDLTRIVLAAR
jgi:hypothetical protein